MNDQSTTIITEAQPVSRRCGPLEITQSWLGTASLLTATAHKLARIVYLALKHGLPYVRKSQEEYEAQMKEKQLKALKRKARLFEPNARRVQREGHQPAAECTSVL